MNARLSSIPIIKLWGQLLVPLQGDLSDSEAARLTSDVLQTIRHSGARGLVVDVSGVAVIDSHLCSVLARLAAAARLMGARALLSGMSADSALTLQTMGLELSRVEVAQSLEDALEALGITAEVVADDPAPWGELGAAGDAPADARAGLPDIE
jgi:rsbT antagonist protein RsbS